MGGDTHTAADPYCAPQKIQRRSGADSERRAVHSSWEGQQSLPRTGAMNLARLGEEGTSAQRGKRPSRGTSWRLDIALVTKDMVPSGPSCGGMGIVGGGGPGRGREVDKVQLSGACGAGLEAWTSSYEKGGVTEGFADAPRCGGRGRLGSGEAGMPRGHGDLLLATRRLLPASPATCLEAE